MRRIRIVLFLGSNTVNRIFLGGENGTKTVSSVQISHNSLPVKIYSFIIYPFYGNRGKQKESKRKGWGGIQPSRLI
jgi:hypothetical protein